LRYALKNAPPIRDILSPNCAGGGHIYTAFGRVAAVFDYLGNVSTLDDLAATRFLFTGREFDAEIDLQYNRARYYDAAIGRWLSQDPIGFGAGDTNLYRYVDNGPTVATDPSGLGKISIIKIIMGKATKPKVIATVDNIEDAARLAAEGEDLLVSSAREAREITKLADDAGREPIHEADKFGKHYHASTRPGGHVFYELYGLTAFFCLTSYLKGDESTAVKCTVVGLDCINPASIPNDLLGLGLGVYEFFTPEPRKRLPPPSPMDRTDPDDYNPELNFPPASPPSTIHGIEVKEVPPRPYDISDDF